jgi:hypothetical protein
MKLPLKSIGFAVAMGLASAAANAQLGTPGYGTTPATNGTLILYLFSPTATGSTTPNYGEQVSLTYTYSQLTPGTAGGPLTPNGSTTPFAVAANPTGAAGSVLQLNFGTVPNFSTFTGTGAGPLDYFVAANIGAANTGFAITSNTALTSSNLTNSGVGLVSTDLGTTPWNTASTTGNTGVDTSGTAAYNPLASAVNGGNMNSINFAGAVNTALSFWNAFLTTSGRTSTETINQYANTTGNGFWFLSSSGDLTWNIPMAASTVPLPAAFWLLGSGLAGLGAISRRRRLVAA